MPKPNSKFEKGLDLDLLILDNILLHDFSFSDLILSFSSDLNSRFIISLY